MLKALYEKILSTAQPVLTVVENSMFCVTSDGTAKELRPAIDHPDTLPLNSLDAMIKMVKTEAPRFTEAPQYITIPNHLMVQCFTQPEPTERFFRQFFYEVKATDVPGWAEKNTLGFEEAQIALRTRFQETPDTLYAMKLVSDISLGAKVIYNDNGIATTITTQKGVALQTNEQIHQPADQQIHADDHHSGRGAHSQHHTGVTHDGGEIRPYDLLVLALGIAQILLDLSGDDGILLALILDQADDVQHQTQNGQSQRDHKDHLVGVDVGRIEEAGNITEEAVLRDVTKDIRRLADEEDQAGNKAANQE